MKPGVSALRVISHKDDLENKRAKAHCRERLCHCELNSTRFATIFEGLAPARAESVNFGFGWSRFLRATRALKKARPSFTPVRNDFLQVLGLFRLCHLQ